MVGLYNNAEAFIFPSIYEGFGLPLLEAMKCNCPVISSNATCLPEVAGNAALYFNPKDKKEILEKIKSINSEKSLRNNLIKKGQIQLQKYSWLNTAKLVKECLNNAY